MKKLMLLQSQPSDWGCVPTAFAIALGIPVSMIIKQLGHDGSAKVWPKDEVDDKYNVKAYHPQELFDFCLRFGVAVTPIDVLPYCQHMFASVNTIPLWDKEYCALRTRKYLDNNYGVLYGRVGNAGHAVAWNGEFIFDPANGGKISKIEDSSFGIETFYVMHHVHV